MSRSALFRFRVVLTATVLTVCGFLPCSGDAAQPVRFNRDIRPILSDKCFHCHGPDKHERKAGLRLDDAASVLEKEALVPGKADASEVIARILSTDPDEIMPPPKSKLGHLSSQEIALLRRWIDEGAKFEAHWAFIPLPPVVPLPSTPHETPSPDQAIDRFVVADLAPLGWKPQPEADRTTLIRRLTYDLTGLPPTPAEVDAFLADTAPLAYERLVDRLLASERYGERMAAEWLDVARYADSYGFQVDRERDVWPWRDWVIGAFNANLPYDQFVTWQLAGDLLPRPTDEQRLATAFCRLHQQESEGGSVEEEYRVEYVNDRVTTFGTAFLGLTLECSRCHDHKFDPLTQKEFYQMFAFFDDIDEAGLYSFFTSSAPTPAMWLTDDAQKQAIGGAESGIKAAEERLVHLREERRAAFQQWLESSPVIGRAVPDEVVRYDFDNRSADNKFASLIPGGPAALSPAQNASVPGRPGAGQAIALTGDHPVTLQLGNYDRFEPFSVSLWMKTPDLKERAVVFHRSRAWTDAASRGYELLLVDGRLQWSLIHFWPGNAVSVRTKDLLPPGVWAQVTVTNDGSSRAGGLGIYLNGQPVATEVVKDHLTRQITGGGGDNITIGERFRDKGFKGGLVDDFRVFSRELTVGEIRELREPGIFAAKGPTSPEEREIWFDAWLSREDTAWRKGLEELKAARQKRSQTVDGLREIMVMDELTKPKPAYVLTRGMYDQRADAVTAGTWAALPPMPKNAPQNRLGLAAWLTDPGHPLFARVTVNRYWQACFGRGLVKTAEDFGSQGERPAHEELLDWLARDFMDHGWDVKHLLRTIVLSRTYRQRSFSDPQQMEADPENVALARGPRHRLPAEMIRDGVLVASGLLVEKIGGPPVRTYDLPESFKPTQAGKGNDLYRRSLYTFWRRTGPAPVLEAFDVPKRSGCLVRRDLTNTPMHALILLNGTQFVEASRVLGETLLREIPGDPAALVVRAHRLLTGRPPDTVERGILIRLFDEELAWFEKHPDEAVHSLQVGDRPRDETLPASRVAAAAAVVSALMNCDAAVVKR